MDVPATSPSLPWKTRLAISVLHAVTDVSRRQDGTVNRRLLSLLNLKSPPYPDPINGFMSYDVTVDRTRNLWFRVFVPMTPGSESERLPVIVFFHGGGFVYLSPDNQSYDAVCRRFSRKIPAIVVSVNYRLAPEYRYPAQYNDGFDVLKFLDENNKRDKILPENADLASCFLMGDSAGGNLAHHVAKRASESTFQQLKVIGLVPIQPFFGGQERTDAEKRLVKAYIVSLSRTDWMWKAFVPDSNRDHEAINVSGPNAADISSLSDFPAALVFVGGFDILQDWQRRYYEWLKKNGKEATLIEYPNMVHAFYVFPELRESGQLIDEVKEFVHLQMNKFSKSD